MSKKFVTVRFEVVGDVVGGVTQKGKSFLKAQKGEVLGMIVDASPELKAQFSDLMNQVVNPYGLNLYATNAKPVESVAPAEEEKRQASEAQKAAAAKARAAKAAKAAPPAQSDGGNAAQNVVVSGKGVSPKVTPTPKPSSSESEEMAEFREFLAFKKMKAQMGA